MGDDGPSAAVVAEILAWASVSEEFVDRWRAPGDVRSKVWEERFGEEHYAAAGQQALEHALERRPDVGVPEIDRLLVAGTHARAMRSVAGRSGAKVDPFVDELASRAGDLGRGPPLRRYWPRPWSRRSPGEIVVLLGLADGAEALLLRTTDAVGRAPPDPDRGGDNSRTVRRSPTDATSRGATSCRSSPRVVPSRPGCRRLRRGARCDWKFGLVGSRSGEGEVSMPPAIGDAGAPAHGRRTSGR